MPYNPSASKLLVTTCAGSAADTAISNLRNARRSLSARNRNRPLSRSGTAIAGAAIRRSLVTQPRLSTRLAVTHFSLRNTKPKGERGDVLCSSLTLRISVTAIRVRCNRVRRKPTRDTNERDLIQSRFSQCGPSKRTASFARWPAFVRSRCEPATTVRCGFIRTSSALDERASYNPHTVNTRSIPNNPDFQIDQCHAANRFIHVR